MIIEIHNEPSPTACPDLSENSALTLMRRLFGVLDAGGRGRQRRERGQSRV